VNDILGGRPWGAKNVVAKVEEHFKGKTSKPFDLILELCGWLTCEFRHQIEVALITISTT
jgi:hypothetical protein